MNALLFYITLGLYVCATVAYLVYLVKPRQILGRAAHWLALTVVIRWPFDSASDRPRRRAWFIGARGAAGSRQHGDHGEKNGLSAKVHGDAPGISNAALTQ